MTFLIFLRVLLSVSASAIQKRMVMRGAPVSAIWVSTYALMFPVACLAALWRWSAPPSSFYWDSLLGGVLDALGNLAMLAALRTTDLSVFGPLNAIRPILALLFGWLFLNEAPSATGLAGIVITVGGAFIVLKDGSTPGGTRVALFKSLGFRLLGFALSTAASVFLKRAANTVSPEMTLAGWIGCGWICLLIYALIHKEPLTLPGQGSWLALHAGAFLVMQWMTIVIFQATLLSYAFVFFQLGMILQTIVGKVVFKEPHFARRLAGCVVMSVGAALIILRG